MGARRATSAGCSSREIRNQRPEASNRDKTFSPKLCNTRRWNNPIMAEAPIRNLDRNCDASPARSKANPEQHPTHPRCFEESKWGGLQEPYSGAVRFPDARGVA